MAEDGPEEEEAAEVFVALPLVSIPESVGTVGAVVLLGPVTVFSYYPCCIWPEPVEIVSDLEVE